MTRLIKRTAEFERLPRAHSFDKRALQASQPSPQYALNTDVPLRGGAAGFTVISHVTVALLLAFLIWWEWQYLLGRPTKMGYWTPMLIGLLQLYVAIDLLGRKSVSYTMLANGLLACACSILMDDLPFFPFHPSL